MSHHDRKHPTLEYVILTLLVIGAVWLILAVLACLVRLAKCVKRLVLARRRASLAVCLATMVLLSAAIGYACQTDANCKADQACAPNHKCMRPMDAAHMLDDELYEQQQHKRHQSLELDIDEQRQRIDDLEFELQEHEL